MIALVVTVVSMVMIAIWVRIALSVMVTVSVWLAMWFWEILIVVNNRIDREDQDESLRDCFGCGACDASLGKSDHSLARVH